ncbi:MAG: lamin tail domain-containing protein [Planctomycetota bacterium]
MKSVTCGIAIAIAAGSASAQLSITEVYTGLSGEDGTVDWIEVTNTGLTQIDTGNFFFDDSNPSLGSGGQLDSFILNAGESAIFLLDGDAADDVTFNDSITEFLAIWGNIANVGLTNGGGNLGQGSDSANILDSTGNIISTLSYAAGGQLMTTENGPDGLRLSVLGENGAFESNAFFNDNLSLPGDSAVLIGSPGAVPTPAGVALLAPAALALTSRRRRA